MDARERTLDAAEGSDATARVSLVGLEDRPGVLVPVTRAANRRIGDMVLDIVLTVDDARLVLVALCGGVRYPLPL